MIIDAMDLLYSSRYDVFCLVSSDSDFTRLAARIRESGITVYGFGEHKTPRPFVAACDKFIYSLNSRHCTIGKQLLLSFLCIIMARSRPSRASRKFTKIKFLYALSEI
jgi:hypothetical protein